MTPSLNDLIGRDIVALKAELARLTNGSELLQLAHRVGDHAEISACAAEAEATARRIAARLHEIGLQAANRSAP